jgi:hypothetical protein
LKDYFIVLSLICQINRPIDGVNITKLPQNLFMSSLEERKKSFIENSWDQSNPMNVDGLSEAGFYYTGEDNKVFCFYCSVGLYEWGEESDPWIEHAKHSPNCHFLKFDMKDA